MPDFILLILCILITGFLGWNIVSILSARTKKPGLFHLESIGLSFLLGIGLIAMQMFIMGLYRISFTRLNILMPWIPVIVMNFLFTKPFVKPKPSDSKYLKITFSELVLLSLIALQVLYNFFRALIKPIESYDAVAIHGLKSKIIYLSGGITPDFFQNISSNFQGAHPDYPLLISLAETWIYTFLGKFDDILVKAIFPLFYLSFIFIFYAVLKRITKSRPISLLFTFFLVSVKQFSDYSTIGYADMELGIYFAISLIYLYLWIRNTENIFFLSISLLASILCLWTKNEGILLTAMLIFVFFAYLVINLRSIRGRKILYFFLYAIIILSFILSWNSFKSFQGLVNENFNPSMISIRSLVENLNKIPIIIYEYQKQLFGFKKWNIIWILFILVFLRGFKTAFSGNVKYITLVFFLFGLGYMLMYIFSAVDVAFFVRFTGSRFLLHILSVAVFWMAVIVSKQRLIENL